MPLTIDAWVMLSPEECVDEFVKCVYERIKDVPLLVTLALHRLHVVYCGAATKGNSLPATSIIKLALLLENVSSCEESASLLLEFPTLVTSTGAVAPPNKKRRVQTEARLTSTPIQQFIPFHKSSRWTCQQRFYADRKVDAWEGGQIPCEISSNPFVAHVYSSAIIKAIEHSRQKLLRSDTSTYPPFRVAVVELGAGHGKLSLMMARELAQSPLLNTEVKVIATDFHDAVFQEQLRPLPWVQSLCRDGRLDFAATGGVESGQGQGLHLLHSGKNTLDDELDLLVIVGNYVFDSLPVRIVTCAGEGVTQVGAAAGAAKAVYEVGVTPRREGKSTQRRGMVPEAYVARRIESTTCDRLVDRLVDELKQSSRRGTFVVPVGGAALLRRVKDAFSVRIPTQENGPQESPSPVMLIMGDCVVAEDDCQWQTDQFVNLGDCEGEAMGSAVGHAGSTLVGISTDNTDAAVPAPMLSLLVPWFDPPLISPLPQAVAVPVNMATLEMAFSDVFGTANTTTTFRCCTPLCRSSFTVGMYSTFDWLVPYDSNAPLPPSTVAAQQSTIVHYPPFGPHDFTTLCQLITDPDTRSHCTSKQVAEALSLPALFTLVASIAQRDIQLLISLLPVLLARLRTRLTDTDTTRDDAATRQSVRMWIELAVRCCDSHACCTWPSFLSMRHSVATWLIAIGSISQGSGHHELGATAFVACLSLFADERLELQGIMPDSPCICYQSTIPHIIRTSLRDSQHGQPRRPTIFLCLSGDEALVCATAVCKLPTDFLSTDVGSEMVSGPFVSRVDCVKNLLLPLVSEVPTVIIAGNLLPTSTKRTENEKNTKTKTRFKAARLLERLTLLLLHE